MVKETHELHANEANGLKLDVLEASNQLKKGLLQDIKSQTTNNIGIYQAQIHIRDINLPQLHSDIHAFKNANHTDIETLETSLTSMEGKQDNISANTALMNIKLDTLETSNQLIKDNGVRSWGSAVLVEGNLIVSAGATHSGSSSFTTIPTKPIIVYVKSHNAITDWFATLQGSIDNTNWFNVKTNQNDIIINPQGLRETPTQQNAELITPTTPYLRVIITNQNGADRGFEIKYIQTN